MKAFILTAGFGNRMMPLTESCHKTLLKVGKETILKNIIDGLLENDVNDICIVTGYNDEQIKDFIKNKYTDLDVEFVHNPDYRTTNNIHSLALGLKEVKIDSDIILIESDLFFAPSLIKKLIAHPGENVALLDSYKSGMDGTVVRVEQGKVVEVIPPHLQFDNFDFSGKFKTLNIYKFSKEFVNTSFKKLLLFYSQTMDNNCYYELILGVLIYMQTDSISACTVGEELWAEMDDPNDLRNATFIFDVASKKEILDESFGGYWNYDILDFAFIRNMYFPTSSMISELKYNLNNLLHNYGSKQDLLNKKLSYAVRLPEENLTLLNGLAQIYPLFREIFSNKRVLIPSPTFGEYNRIFPQASVYDDNFGIDEPAFIANVQLNDVVVVVNPNNPTGTSFSSGMLANLITKFPEKYFIVDESFIDFSKEESILDTEGMQPAENLVLIKSLSKVWGVPGIRLGYVHVTNSSLKKQIKDYIPIWNSNSMAEFFLEIILKHKNSLQNSIVQTIADREALRESLMKLNLFDEVYESQSQYLVVRLDERYSQLDLSDELIQKYGIYLRQLKGKLNVERKYFRVAVRTPEDHEKLTSALTEIYDNLG
jgi:histidinol-phosphate/aromatic aminotransferase/cobyric acid decarboxylase-like protein/choline kinase